MPHAIPVLIDIQILIASIKRILNNIMIEYDKRALDVADYNISSTESIDDIS